MPTNNERKPDGRFDTSNLVSFNIPLRRINPPTYQALVCIQGGWGLALLLAYPFDRVAVLAAVPVGGLIARLATRRRKHRPVTPITFLINVVAAAVITATSAGHPMGAEVTMLKAYVAAGLIVIYAGHEMLARLTVHLPPPPEPARRKKPKL